MQKGTFFYHFKNKEALGEALVEYHLQCGSEMTAHAPFLDETDTLRKLMAYVDFIISSVDDQEKQGCLLGVFSNEIASSKNDIQTALAAVFNGWAEQIAAMIDEAGMRSGAVDTRGLADFFISSFEGGLILARGTDDIGQIKNSLTHYKNYLTNVIASGA